MRRSARTCSSMTIPGYGSSAARPGPVGNLAAAPHPDLAVAPQVADVGQQPPELGHPLLVDGQERVQDERALPARARELVERGADSPAHLRRAGGGARGAEPLAQVGEALHDMEGID